MYIKKSVLVTCAVVLVLATAFLAIGAVNPFGFTNLGELIRFSYVARLTESQYYEDVAPEDYTDMALLGLTAATGDPYTRYIFGEEAEAYTEELEGNYQGVGLYIEADTSDNTIRVVSAIAGTPAEEAGLVTGDKILKINDVPFTGEQLNDASSEMRGMEGTEVTLEVRKADTGETVTLTLQRREIKLETVTSGMLTENIGRISISQFVEGTSDDFAKQYGELKVQGMTKMVLDLRNNPGGYLDEAVKIANTFIDDGEIIVYTMDKYGRRQNYTATGAGEEMQIVILTNGGTASASEVFSGALKDYGIAVLMGEKTYGKGIVQNVIPIGDDSVLSVTCARYYTPNGVCIHGEGLQPDQEVPMDLSKYSSLTKLTPEEDEQLSAAIAYLQENA